MVPTSLSITTRLRPLELTVPRRKPLRSSPRRPLARRIQLPRPTLLHRRASSTLRPAEEHRNLPHRVLTLRRRISPSPAALSTNPAHTHRVPRPRLPLRNLSPLPHPFRTGRAPRRREPQTIRRGHEAWATTTRPDPTAATPPPPQPRPVSTIRPASPLRDTTPSTGMAHRTRRTMNRRRPSPTSPSSTGPQSGTTSRPAGTLPSPSNQQLPQHLTRDPTQTRPVYVRHRAQCTRMCRHLDPTRSTPRHARQNRPTLPPLGPSHRSAVIIRSRRHMPHPMPRNRSRVRRRRPTLRAARMPPRPLRGHPTTPRTARRLPGLLLSPRRHAMSIAVVQSRRTLITCLNPAHGTCRIQRLTRHAAALTTGRSHRL